MNHTPIRLLTLALLWAASTSAQAGNKIIPHLFQDPDFSTRIIISNLCSFPASYLIRFIGFDGAPVSMAFSDGELWSGVYNNEVPPGANYSFSLPESEESRQGYGNIMDDGDGCIAFEVHYRQLLQRQLFQDESFKWAQIVPRQFSSPGVAVSFYLTDSCDTAVFIAGDGTLVSLEATDRSGEILDQIELGHVHHAAFMMKDEFPLATAALENGSSSGMLKISGNVNAMGVKMCDGEIVRHRYVHLLPQTVQYEVVSFSAKHLKRRWIETYIYGHKYAYRLTIKNPTQKDFTYEAEVLFRDEDGFVVDRADIGGFDVPAGETRTFEGTVDKGLRFETDPGEITVEVSLEVYNQVAGERLPLGEGPEAGHCRDVRDGSLDEESHRDY